MENIGIDIGSFKTVISTSQNNGSIIYDSNSKRCIQTAAELRTPVRYFGNSLPEITKKFIHLRKRNFAYITDDNNIDALTMNSQMFYLYSYIKYLQKIPQTNPFHFTFSVPYFYGLKEKEDLHELLKQAGINAYLMTDIVSLGMLFNSKYEKSKDYEYSLIIDLGHEKTTVGLFHKQEEASNGEKSVVPIYINGIKKGGKNFSDKIINFIIKKYEMTDSEYVREKLNVKVDLIKSMLNNLSDFKFVLEIIDESYEITVTKEEYHELIKGDLLEFEEFFSAVQECIEECMREGATNTIDGTDADAPANASVKSLCIEVVGGNSFNSFMRSILDRMFKCNYSMNADESVATGLSYAGALHKFGNKLKLNMKDALTKEIGIRVYDYNNTDFTTAVSPDECKVITLKKLLTLIPTNLTTLTYKKKNDFIAEFVEDKKVIKRILVFNIKNSVEINFSVEKRNSLKINVVNADFKEERRNFDELINLEDKMKKNEEEAETVKNMRNELEKILMGINTNEFYNTFGNLNENEINTINEVCQCMMYEKIPEKIEDEEKKRNEINQNLCFINEKINDFWIALKNKLKCEIEIIENLLKENSSFYVKSIYKLKGLIFKINENIKNLNGNVFDYQKIVEVKNSKYENELESLKQIYIAEIIEKKEEAKANEAKASEEKASEDAKAGEDKASEDKTSEEKANEDKTGEDKACEDKVCEDKACEDKACEEAKKENFAEGETNNMTNDN